ncbi:MAG: DUF1461 domain-containing protein [Coriobacteriales bacterium]|jgi:integral membrane protein (TIGR01906 family)|nr:DUF1461 domain-containing protein [Coriobacteriales bacterium]
MARVVLTILLAVFLPLAALMVVLSTPVVQALGGASIANSAADPAEREHLVEVALAVRDFSLGNDAAAMPAGEDYRIAITPDAKAHLLDVRRVFICSEFASVSLAIALFIMMLIVVRRSGPGTLSRPLIIGGIIPLAGSALLGIAIAVDFSAFFVWMHGLFFANGSWTFPADSLLIRALPYDFWVGCAEVWALSMALFCMVSIGAGLILKRRSTYLDNSLPR